MQVRCLSEADLPDFRRVWEEGLARFPDAFLFSPEDARDIPDDVLRAGLAAGHHWGAFSDNGDLIGIASARRSGPRRLRHTADIGPFYVRPDAQRGGVGKALLQAVLDALCAQGVAQAELVVDAENTKAQALYAGAGFHVFGLRPRSVVIDGVARDDLLMIRALDDTDLRRTIPTLG